MMAPPNPPRLRDGQEFGDLLARYAAEAPSAERLAHSAAIVEQRLAAPPLLIGGGPAALATGGALKVGAIVVGVAAASVVGYHYLAPAPRPATPPAVTAPPSPPVAAPAPSAAPRPAGSRPSVAPPRRITAPAPAAHSDLPEQVRLFTAAKDAARAGHYDEALRHLDELARRFPATPLKAEAQLSRADYLARAGRLDEAIAAVEKLVESPRHVGRRPELWHVLGDLRVKRGDCGAALTAYRQALALGRPEPQAETIRRGIEKCGGR
jgi:tetratricopeptide (TPR) repeat protein